MCVIACPLGGFADSLKLAVNINSLAAECRACAWYIACGKKREREARGY
jgi:hypothetical protein